MENKPKTTPRRSKGEGSFTRTKDGWKGYVTINGTRIYRRAQTKQELRNKLASATTKPILQRQPKSDTTLTEFIRAQLEGPLKSQLRYATWSLYECFWRTRVATCSLGNLRLASISRSDVQAFIDSHRQTYKPASLRRLGSFVCMILERAVEEDILAQNPARKIRYPTIVEHDRTIVPLEDVKAFLDCFRSPRLKDMVLVALHTGLRRGELCGLRWQDISEDDCSVSVAVQVTRHAHGIIQSDLKTKGSRRTVELTKVGLETLLSQPRRSEYLFTTESGRPIRPDTLARDFRLATKNTPFAALRLHDLRASYISMLLALGTDVRTVQELVGHASSDMTLRVYARSQRSLKRSAADRLGAAVTSKLSSKGT